MTRAEEGFGEIITFYSYKGGTGRSMAAANVGYLLATTAVYPVQRVLLIDWDLEAPGLPRYFREEFPGGSTPGHPLREASGLIDYFTDVAAAYGTLAPAERLPEGAAGTARAREVYDIVAERHPFAAYVQQSPVLPRLHLCTAGRQLSGEAGEGYAARVRGFDWDGFYHNYGSFFPFFRDELMRAFDYVLIDSRTGLTDTGGICTRVMPEKLVTVFVPNRQNIEGVAQVIRAAAGYRRRSRDLRGLVAFPLASRIDASNQRLRQVWWHGGEVDGDTIEGYQPTFERLLQEVYVLPECSLGDYFNATQVPHDSDYAFGESIAARRGTSDRFSIGGACAGLVERLVTLDAPWDEVQDLRTQYESVRSTAEEHARRAAMLEARLERTRRVGSVAIGGIVLVVIVAAGVLVGAQLGLRVGLLSLSMLALFGLVLVGLVLAAVGWWRESVRRRAGARQR